LKRKEIRVTINRYRYFYACAFSMFEKHLVAFVDEMVEHDHAESTVKIYLSCVNDVAKAMHAAGIAASDLDEARAIELVAAMGWIKSRETYARFMMKRFVRFLAERGAARERPALSPKEAARLEMRVAYEDYLRRQRGLSERTIIDSWRFAEQILDFRFPDGADDLGNLSAGDIARFLQARVIQRAPRDKTVPSHLRNFFRYLFKTGETVTNLANAVPRVAQRFGTRLPRHLSLEQVDMILDAVRNTAPASLRNYAMVLLMARLGLRPPEVVAMQIDDIDWRSGEILVRGKGDRHDRLPLLPAIFDNREYAVAGGLASYGADFLNVMQLSGVYTGRILNGKNPADLPVVLSAKYEFVINLKTAKLLGIKVSDNMLSLADEVIE
jgi:site-specific recombinase XerD